MGGLGSREYEGRRLCDDSFAKMSPAVAVKTVFSTDEAVQEGGKTKKKKEGRGTRVRFALKKTFPVFDDPHVPPPPCSTLRKVEAVTDSSTAVTCPIRGDVRVPGTTVFVSLSLCRSMRAFHTGGKKIFWESG